LLLLDDTGASARLNILRSAATPATAVSDRNGDNINNSIFLPTRGLLLADEMGLGKTIEALAGAALRSVIIQEEQLPHLIVSPQDGIQNQWYDTLIKSGVEPTQITIIGETKTLKKERTSAVVGGDTTKAGIDSKKRGRRGERQPVRYFLCTRHKIQSEMKGCFNACSLNYGGGGGGGKKEKPLSVLFSDVPLKHIESLKNQYLSDKGKERNKFIKKDESRQDCVARLVCNIGKALGNKAMIFQTVIIDEAHFCKNALAYWGLGLALLGQRSKRNVLLTGTPYNNGPADMSSLMTYIDPSHKASRFGWWKDATALSSSQAIKEAVSDWRDAFMLRRTKDVLNNELPPRSKINIEVACYASELWIYEVYETKFLKSLKQMTKFINNPSPEARQQMKQVFQIMMACMANMRMSLIHPVLTGGREATIQFSPSRKRFLKREERSKICVFCAGNNPSRAAEKFTAEKKTVDNEEQQKEEVDENDEILLGLNRRIQTHIDLDDEDLDDNDDSGATSSDDEDKGPILPLSPDICRVSGSGCRHFAHAKCIENHREKQDCIGCPRCNDLEKRIHMEHTRAARTVYCKDTSTSMSHVKGFTASAKIEEAIKWFQTAVPQNEKAIIMSFFKGSLDLIEGILTNDLGVECARYDGDINKKDRVKELDKFKTTGSCRVLLASVQSGGTGLNIVEANHVLFLDRWFNPCVHDQAESRVHRLGQTKEVKIAYLDCNQTVDVVMKSINILKEGNASILLADGTSLGMVASSLGYRDLSGVIGNNLRAIKEMRCSSTNDNESVISPHNDSDLEAKLELLMSSKSAGTMKKEDTRKDDHSENLTNPTNTVSTQSFQQTLSTLAHLGFDSIRNAVTSKLPGFPSGAKFKERCVICGIHSATPYVSTCGHIACWECWQSRHVSSCPQCGNPVTLGSLRQRRTQPLLKMDQIANGSSTRTVSSWEREIKPTPSGFQNPYNPNNHPQPSPTTQGFRSPYNPNYCTQPSPRTQNSAAIGSSTNGTVGTRECEIKSTLTKLQNPLSDYSTQPTSRTDKSAIGDSSGIASIQRADTKQQRESFFRFTRVLLNYLAQKDNQMHVQAKINIKDCFERNKRKEPGYESITESMKRRLKDLVGDHYWKRANDDFLKQKRRQVAACSSSISISRGSSDGCNNTQQKLQQSYVLPRSKPTRQFQKKLLTPRHSKTVIEKVADKKKRNLNNLKLSRLKRQKRNNI